ncbi:hypothetical protein N6L27_20735 [Leisingera sp. SS27]|uniref:calcium-binding protein n=1 Tax=Leisingera sp. SS27 TaxID=2979462 RepID=UPI00232ECEF8|nr:hypothetical protein [Leisingera sp. SS27]MDC0660440.1 hypothetical protein [Leisingera sp. SS27]
MALAFTGRFGTDDMIFGTDLRDLEITVQNGQATLYAINGLNGGISRWQLPGTGGVPQLAGQQLHGQASLRTGNFELAEIGGDLRLLQEGTSGGLSYYALGSGGSLGSQQQQALAGADAGGLGAVAVLQLAGGGLQGWQLDADGAVQAQAGLGGAAQAYQLDTSALLSTVQTAGGPVVLAADAGGLRAYSADAATGALTPGAVLGAGQGLSVSGITALESFEMDGKAWALLAAAGSSSLTLVQVDAAGGLQFRAQLHDTAMTRFGGVSALEVVQAGEHLLVLAAGNDGGLSLFTLTPGGALIHVQSLEHMPGLGLQNVTALEAVVAGGQLQVFAASGTEGGISRFTLPLAELGIVRQAGAGDARLDGSAANDVLEGGAGAADLYGHAGDDVLVSGAGGGELNGGAGADIFVIAPVSDPVSEAVTVRDFTPGEDRLDLSLFEGLYSPAQLQSRGRSYGIDLEIGGMRIVVAQAGGGRLELEDVFGPALQFEFPQQQELGDTLPGGGFYGTAGHDALQGSSGDDAISGLAGDDTLSGGGGADTLWGGWGHDQLGGSWGADRLWGGGGHDRLWGGGGRDMADGGLGNDSLWGGDGQDSLWGRDGDDRLDGGSGADRLAGGAGLDWLGGGSGADTLLGEDGQDTLAGGDGADVLWGGSGGDVIYGGGGDDQCGGGDGNDRIFGGAGNDRLGGGGGDDGLTGGWGADAFVFAAGHGRDTVTDFAPGTDWIDLQALALSGGFAALEIRAQGSGTLIGTGSGTVFLEGVQPGQLAADDFLF